MAELNIFREESDFTSRHPYYIIWFNSPLQKDGESLFSTSF